MGDNQKTTTVPKDQPLQKNTRKRKSSVPDPVKMDANKSSSSTKPPPNKNARAATTAGKAVPPATEQPAAAPPTNPLIQPPKLVHTAPPAGTTTTDPAADPMDKLYAYMGENFAVFNSNFVNLTSKADTSIKKVDNLTSSLASVSAKCDTNAEELDKLKKTIAHDRVEASREIDRKINQAMARKMSDSEPAKQLIENKIREAVSQQMDKVTKEVDRLIAIQTVRNVSNSTSTAMSRQRNGSSAEEDERAFWLARKRMRCFPVTGRTTAELEENAFQFFREKLDIPEEELTPGTITEIRRVAAGRRKKGAIKDEVLVTFSSIQLRDTFASYAPNLKEWREDNNAAANAAGIRLEIPDHLCGVFRNLERHGHALRQQFGVGFKRRTKYDDGLMTLYLDVLQPGPDQEWYRIDNDEAAASARSRIASTDSNRSGSQSEPPKMPNQMKLQKCHNS